MDVESLTAAAAFWGIPSSRPAGGKGDGIAHVFTYRFVMGVAGCQVFEIEIIEKVLILIGMITNT
jgi:hypothetical protein